MELRKGTDFSKWTGQKSYDVEIREIELGDIPETLKAFFRWEESVRFPEDGKETKEIPRINLYCKGLSYEKRREIVRAALNDENCMDMNLLLNIYNLIKMYNTFSPDFFSSPAIIVNSAEEFLDMMEDLEPELGRFRRNLITWFISAIRSCGIAESYSEKPVVIPFSYQMILFMTDFVSLSNMMKSETEIQGKIRLVGNADNIILSLSKKQVIMYDIMDQIRG